MYKRVLLKLSGEALSGQEKNFDPAVLQKLAEEIKEAQALGVQIAVVVGGGNFIRGKTLTDIGIDRVQGDYMGMLATIINALAIQSALEGIGIDTRVQTAVEMNKIAEPFIQRRAIRHLEKGRVVIFGGGTGSPKKAYDTATGIFQLLQVKEQYPFFCSHHTDQIPATADLDFMQTFQKAMHFLNT